VDGALIGLMTAAKGLVLVMLVFLAAPLAGAAPPGRERLLMDVGWRFQLGRPGDVDDGGFVKAGNAHIGRVEFDDNGWRPVDLPHDWGAEMPFSEKASNSHGSRTLGRGFPETAIGWYRRRFTIPASDLGRRVSIELDGAYRDSMVWLNGHYLGRNESGYSGFRFDVTDYLEYGGLNALAVRVDASAAEGWFYEGAGIYRHVWMIKTAPVHVAAGGTTVTSEVAAAAATVTARTRLVNEGRAPVRVTLDSVIVDPHGRRVAGGGTTPVALAAGESKDLAQTLTVASPQLWSPETPSLYRMLSTVKVGGDDVDRLETRFGIRTVAFDPDRGFLLNGRQVWIKGTCNHQDHAGVGAALPDRLQRFRIERLKAMGSNAYRTSHNPPTPELLDAADELGMMVLDENRLLGSSPEVLDQLRRLIERDRNHPSVIAWSIANEEYVQNSAAAERMARTMKDLVARLDPGRPITYAGNNHDHYEGINRVVDVRGWNYGLGPEMDRYHAAHPRQPQWGSEQASTFATRGEYADDRARSFSNAADVSKPGYGATAEEWWSFFAARPWLSGGFVWTGFDYRGEPSPYRWPAVSSQFGVLDTCGFPKDDFYYYQAWWGSAPVVHLLPHWTWPGREGEEIEVRGFGNTEEVELLLDGASLGKQKMPRNGHLAWKVKYRPGVLSARGLNGGKVAAETKVETAGPPAALRLSADRTKIDGDGEDLALVTVSAVDAEGRPVPRADQDVTFTLSGAGRIIGVGNGHPASHEPDQFLPGAPRVFAPARWRGALVSGSGEREVAATFDDRRWPEVHPDDRSLRQEADGKAAVYRATVELPAERPRVALSVGPSRRARIYVNGVQVTTPAPSWDLPAVVSLEGVKLRKGRNTLAVAVEGRGAAFHDGAAFLIDGAPAPPWHRRLFNGLAQVIVQSRAQAGAIELDARAPSLTSGHLTLESAAVRPRPHLP
jgi:beta-galactosidase